MYRITFFLICCIVLAGCQGRPPYGASEEPMQFTLSNFSEMPGWQTGRQERARLAFIASCEHFATLPDDYVLAKYSGTPTGTVLDWRNVCSQAIATQPGRGREFFETHFIPFRVSTASESPGLFTGYYEIELQGSRTPSTNYPYPLYRLPDNLKNHKGAPHFSRAAIEAGSLQGQGLELLYVNDPVALFFLHIQGSGQVRLPDGETVRVGYAGQNGHSYHSLGAAMVDEGIFDLEEVTAPKIMDWLYNNPDRAHDMMNLNPSYIFFRIIDNQPGPIGGQGVALTAQHSLAIDSRFVSYGTPLWLDTTLPDEAFGGKPAAWYEQETPPLPYQMLVIAQDKGGAIKGSIRGDVFFGHGNMAAKLAGTMKQPGTLYVLLPHDLALALLET